MLNPMVVDICPKDMCLPESASVRDAVIVIDRSTTQVALVTRNNKLVGVVTDGDVRRGILNGVSLDTSVAEIMSKGFFSMPPQASNREVLALMKKYDLRHVPILEPDGDLIRLVCLSDFQSQATIPNPVLIMAGGEGRRLLPLTQNLPKPMIEVAGRPLLEIIFQQCIDAGFHEFFFSVKYLKEQIMDYFSDGSKWGVSISYLEEDQPLGTAGALSLLPTKPSFPILLINGDVLTRVDFRTLLQFHNDNKALATLCIRECETKIPFGVARTDGMELVEIEEKPVIKNQVNAGLYVLSPDLLDLVPKNLFLDMPNLLNSALRQGHRVTAFPVHEYWLDIGQPDTLARAHGEWS